jgi:transmembrane E3 ubiquitin-protein ligase
LEPLLDHFNVFNSYIDRNTESYYPNITGFIQGDTSFHNITYASWSNSSEPVPAWGPLSEPLMAGANMTELVEHLGTWNWTASEKVALSVMEKTVANIDLSGRISMVHVSPFEDIRYLVIELTFLDTTFSQGRIELTDVSTKEEFRLEFEGVHFITSGSIYGFADPVGYVLSLSLLYVEIYLPTDETSISDYYPPSFLQHIETTRHV